MGIAPQPHKDLPATETTAKELTSPGRRSEADHANGFMMVGGPKLRGRLQLDSRSPDTKMTDASGILECGNTF